MENMSLGFPARERALVVTQWPVTRAAAYKQAVWSTRGARGSWMEQEACWRLRRAGSLPGHKEAQGIYTAP